MLSPTYIDSTIGGGIILAHSRNATIGSHTVLQNDDKLGSIFFEGSDGTEFARGAQIQAYVDGTPGTNDMPGRIEFSTTADGSDSPTENARITSDGRVLMEFQLQEILEQISVVCCKLKVVVTESGIAVVRNSDNVSGPSIDLGKSRGYPNTIVNSGDVLGQITFSGADGIQISKDRVLVLRAIVDGTPGADDMPTRLVFATTADGASAPTAHWQIDSTGRLDQLNSSAGIRFQYGHSVTPNDLEAVLSNTLDDFESGDLDWEIHKDNGLTTGTNVSGAHAKYVKIFL